MGKEAIRKTDFLLKKGEEVPLNRFAPEVSALGKLDPDFKMIVSDLKDFLEETKLELDSEESRIRSEDQGWELGGHSEWVDIAERIVTGQMNQAFSKMSDIVVSFSPAEHTSHRNYFQHQLHPLLLHSPFVRRAYLKPLGYPGDYQMMNMIYGDHDQGDSLFAHVMNRYSCRATAARAVAGRVPYLLQKFDQTINRVSRERETVALLSVGSGPAREIRELITTNPLNDQCHVSLVDMLPEALSYCQEKILDLKSATGSRITAAYFNRSVRDFIRFPHTLEIFREQDLIYAIGLFDYLPFHTAKRVIQNLYPLLAEGGELIIGNFDLSNPTRFYMEYALEWYLLYRSQEEMLRLAEEIPFPASSYVESDEGGVQLYLIIEKTEKAGGLLGDQGAVATFRHTSV